MPVSNCPPTLREGPETSTEWKYESATDQLTNQWGGARDAYASKKKLCWGCGGLIFTLHYICDEDAVKKETTFGCLLQTMFSSYYCSAFPKEQKFGKLGETE